MRAMITTKYGPPEVLQLQEVKKPFPKKREILVKVHATTVSSGDCRARSFNVPPFLWLQARLILGIFKPRNPIQGLWLSGVVESVGEQVTSFSKGDKIYARTPDIKFGAYAEYACLPEKSIMHVIPAKATYEEAVALPFGGLTALHFLKKAGVVKGQKILVYGASGAVGSSAVQLANYFGTTASAVCSTENMDLVKSLGAHEVFDYTKQNLAEITGKFDVIFDAVGKAPYAKVKHLMEPQGKYISVITSGHMKMDNAGLAFLNQLFDSGKFKAVIDRVYPFNEMVDAHRYVEKGHKKGNVVVKVA